VDGYFDIIASVGQCQHASVNSANFRYQFGGPALSRLWLPIFLAFIPAEPPAEKIDTKN
jgi:hypothetical protein